MPVDFSTGHEEGLQKGGENNHPNHWLDPVPKNSGLQSRRENVGQAEDADHQIADPVVGQEDHDDKVKSRQQLGPRVYPVDKGRPRQVAADNNLTHALPPSSFA